MIAVFDSGLGSLNVVQAIRDVSRCDIIYYADTANHPYGMKPPAQLRHIIFDTIYNLRERFDPDVVVVGSHTPTLLLDGIEDDHTIGVWPPLREAASISSYVTILATRSVIESDAIRVYADSLHLDITIQYIDASELVRLAEYGTFLYDVEECRSVVYDTLCMAGEVCILSSTHLPFLRHIMESVRPDVKFLDPINAVARRAISMTCGGNNTLQIYTSGGHDISHILRRLGVWQDITRIHLGDNHA